MSSEKQPAAAPAPPDQDERQQILTELQTTMLVEASAGSGKTTSMVGRMVELLGEGHCTVDTLAAITFTRKAAGELRGRFQVALEAASRETTGRRQQRLREAADHVARCFVGTIHSFCGRLLRERPVESGVDPAFRELDDATDARLREEAWDEFVTSLLADPGNRVLHDLAELGLQIDQLHEPFLQYADYPDVHDWPAEEVEFPSLKGATEALVSYARHIGSLLPELPEDPGNDRLMPAYRRVARMVRQADLQRPAELLEILEEFGKKKIVQKQWPGGREQALAELGQWDRFAEQYAERLVGLWRRKRYPLVLRVLAEATKMYDRRRRAACGLNYQDLLLQSADLLRDKPTVRRYFSRRLTHLLVDEFQDTDPVQAEVMLLLTADDPDETVWRSCRPRPGSLFVVGDPKQSIYRFRRADIVTYDEVKRIIERHGKAITLWANFRSQRPVVEWSNRTFDEVFPAVANAYSPERRPMESAHSSGPGTLPVGVCTLNVPAECCKKNDEAVEYESQRIAEAIHAAVSSADGEEPLAVPGDFLILAARKRNLGAYAEKLARLGIPAQVTGGAVLNEVEELGLLHRCLRAITQPDNPVALVAALRSELFGVSDTTLFALRQAGGQFDFRRPLPERLPAETAQRLDQIWHRLRDYDRLLRHGPPVAAVERIAAELGLPARAAAGAAGNVHAGSLARAIELLRAAQQDAISSGELVDYLGQLVNREETHDGLPARPPNQSPVRIMNLHQAKGLEAPIVFLADPTGQTVYPPQLHIDRSGDRVLGYLAITGDARGRTRPLLACPGEWESWAAEEEEFSKAEKLRLHYVAATRAGSQLVVTQREKGNPRNPWNFFADALDGCPELEGTPSVQGAPLEHTSLRDEEPAEAAEAISGRWRAATRPGYAMVAAKAVSVTGASPMRSAGEHGTEWGTVVHSLLETAMARPQAELYDLARTALEEQGLAPSLAGEVIATVRAVTRSDVWQRALRAERRLVEVSFQTLLPDDSPHHQGVPTIVRGVIDLAFCEAGGWVIVDYKTDAQDAARLDALVDHYRGQLLTYAEAWHAMLGETVAETGLYFTHVDRYVVVS
ncbi:MAG: UvrD-helicase domain-containing protein [Planctomycetes bacterium]|nr:UvrD-helicase domain-containing protein [Planctomycetota bacterium]